MLLCSGLLFKFRLVGQLVLELAYQKNVNIKMLGELYLSHTP